MEERKTHAQNWFKDLRNRMRQIYQNRKRI